MLYGADGRLLRRRYGFLRAWETALEGGASDPVDCVAGLRIDVDDGDDEGNRMGDPPNRPTP